MNGLNLIFRPLHHGGFLVFVLFSDKSLVRLPNVKISVLLYFNMKPHMMGAPHDGRCMPVLRF